MKTMKKALLCIMCLCVCLSVAAIAIACDKDPTPTEHTHSYTAVGKDADGHWNYCPDDNTKDDSSVAAHTDADADGKCDVCGYEMTSEHVHQYTAVDNDSDGHWNYCPDDNTKDDSSVAEHVDSDGDGKCDVCGYEHDHYLELSNIVAPTGSKDGSARLYCSISRNCIDKNIVLKKLYLGQTITIEAGEEAYYYMSATSEESLPYEISAAISDGVEAKLLVYAYDKYVGSDKETVFVGKNETLADGQLAQSGDDTNFISAYVFAVTATEEGSFYVNYQPGSDRSNPIKMEKNKYYEGTGASSVWYSYKAKEDEEVVFFVKEQLIGWNTSSDVLQKYDTSVYCMDTQKYLGGEINILSLQGGSTYTFFVSSKYKIAIQDKEADRDYTGYSLSLPKEITNNYSATDTNGTRYYVYTAGADGRLETTIAADNGNYSFDIYSTSGEFLTNKAYIDEHGNMYVEAGQKVVFEVTYYYADGNGAYTISLAENSVPDTQTNTVVLTDVFGEILSGMTVVLKDGETEVATGTTDAEGKCSFVCNRTTKYEIVVETGDDYKQSTKSYIEWDRDDATTDSGKEYGVSLDKKVTKTFVAKVGDNKFSGVTVKVVSGNTVIVSGITDEEGKTAALEFFSGDYTITVEGLPNGYLMDAYKLDRTNSEAEVALPIEEALNEFTVHLVAEDSSISVAGITIVFTNYWGNKEYGTAVTDANGVAVAYFKNISQYYVQAIGLPDGVTCEKKQYGYTVDPATNAPIEDRDITLTLKGKSSGSGGGSSTAYATKLEIGDNLINATYLGTELTFTAEEDASYIIYCSSNQYYPIINEEPISNNYVFYLEKGESITIKFSIVSTTLGSYEYTVTLAYNNGAR